MLKYKKLYKYYTYVSLNQIKKQNSNFLLGNLLYYNNISCILYQDFIKKLACQSIYLRQPKFNISRNGFLLRFNFNVLILLHNLNFFTKIFFEDLRSLMIVDLIYLRLNTHVKLISVLYLYNNILCKYGFTLFNILLHLVLILYIFRLKLIKILLRNSIQKSIS